MASTFSNLKFELIGTGDQSGTWGTTTNTNLGTAIEQALVGMATISSGFTGSPLTLTLTLTDTNAAQNARALVLNLTQALGSAGTLNVPAIQKPYMIINATGQTVTVKVTGLTGVAVPTGTRAFLYNNGTDVGAFFNYAPSLTLGTDLAVADGGTGASDAATARTNLGLGTIATQAASNVSITGGSITGITDLAVADGGTGASTAPNARTNLGATTVGSNLFTLTNPSAITFLRINADNTVSALDAATFRTAIGAGTGGGSVTQVDGTGTVQGLTLTGSVTSSGSLTLGGSLSAVSLTTQVSGTLPVGNGGTGITTGTSGGVPYFSATNTIASSAALAANALVIGGGAGVAPATTTTGSGVVTAIGNSTNAASGLAVLNASGNLNVAQGGTGAGTFTANNVLLGNGTSAFQTVAPGTTGNVLTSNGTTWTSSAPAGGALTNNTRQAVTSSATTTINLNSGNVIDLTMAANITTLSFTNVPASGTPILIQIVVRNASDGTAYTIAWPNSVYWSGQYAAASPTTVQTAPTLATGANGVTVIALLTTDGGTKWRGWVEATIPGGAAYTIYSWGYNGGGQLGLSSFINESSPVQIGTTVWTSIAMSFANTTVNGQALAVRVDGTLWAWGRNNAGQLGLGNLTPYSSPKQVGALTNWSQVSSGSLNSSLAIKTDGTLWAWGRNSDGQLGLGNVTNYSSPKQVGALTNWSKVSAGAYNFTAAIKTDGTLWGWGANGAGQLGLGNITSYSSPKQVGALTNWSQVNAFGYACAAIKTDGTLWSWGVGQNGRLGQNSLTNRSSPVQIGAGTDWAQLTVGGYRHQGVVKTGGTLWVWGENNFGQLGLGNVTSYSSPKQVGALTNWSRVFTGSICTFGLKTDGTLWSWGSGNSGRLGLNSTADYSSPKQIGSSTNWGPVAASLSVIALNGPQISPA